MKHEYKSDDVYLSRVNYTFITQFENYLRNCKPLNSHQPLSNNGLMKHMERFQKLINLAYKHGWITKNQLALYKLKFEEYECSFLEQEELDLLEQFDLSKQAFDTVRWEMEQPYEQKGQGDNPRNPVYVRLNGHAA